MSDWGKTSILKSTNLTSHFRYCIWNSYRVRPRVHHYVFYQYIIVKNTLSPAVGEVKLVTTYRPLEVQKNPSKAAF